MRIHKLLATALVALVLFPSCEQEEDYVLPSIDVGTGSLDFSDDTSLKVNVTATRDWQVRSKPDWVAVDPDHGTRSSQPQRVLVSVLPNSDYNRSGEILFTIGLAKAAVSVVQPGAKGEKPKGSGTKEDPYTVGGALEFVSNLAADTPTTEDVYIFGKISQITESFSAQFGNATFYISDNDGASFYVYRTLYLGNKKWTASDTQIKDGDEVIICGQVVNFKGNTPETNPNKSFLYSLNGQVVEPSGGGGGTPSGTGTLADPYNAAGANAYIKTLADNAESDKDVYVKGKISKIANNGEFGSYGNATFYITDDGTTAGEDFYCYRVLYLGNKEWKTGDTQIKVGDEVVICGRVTKYVNNSNTTYETVQKKAYIYSLNGTTGDSGGGTTPTPTPTSEIKTVSVADFIAATPSESQKYQLTGKISGSINTTYGNFDLVDDTGSVYVYGLTKTELGYGAQNDKSFASLNLKAGDTVTLIGYRGVFGDKVEVLHAYYVSHTPGSN